MLPTLHFKIRQFKHIFQSYSSLQPNLWIKYIYFLSGFRPSSFLLSFFFPSFLPSFPPSLPPILSSFLPFLPSLAHHCVWPIPLFCPSLSHPTSVNCCSESIFTGSYCPHLVNPELGNLEFFISLSFLLQPLVTYGHAFNL